jgi:hypothetical protein
MWEIQSIFSQLFDHALDGVYYPQEKSFEWGIHLYFQRMAS